MIADADVIARNQKIVEIVTTPGTVVRPGGLGDGYVVVIDGRTGRDVCEPTAAAAFDALLKEENEKSEGFLFDPVGEFPPEAAMRARHEANEQRARAKDL